jgi:glycosyltransferase involved in cell wall biosynthesis
VSSPEISVIVSTYERPTELARVLEGYRLQTFKDFEVVVADDGSGPETKVVVERYHGTGLRVVHARHEHDGFRAAAARNMGVRASSGAWIVFADGDCVPFPTFLEEHARARDGLSFLAGERYLLEEDEAKAVTVDAVASGEAFRRAPARERKRLRGIAVKNAFYRATALKPDRPKLLTSNCSVARKAFGAVNGLDERYRGWGREDDDLRRRLVRSGLRARSLVGKANLLHLWHPPVASFKGTVRAGPNEPYFQRGFFLSRCRTGLEQRPLESVAFAIASADAGLAGAARRAIQKSDGDRAGPVEVELLLDDPRSPPPRFQRDAEVRVLVQEAPPALARTKGAHVILHAGEGPGAPLSPALARFTASYGQGPIAGALARVVEILDATL